MMGHVPYRRIVPDSLMRFGQPWGKKILLIFLIRLAHCGIACFFLSPSSLSITIIVHLSPWPCTLPKPPCPFSLRIIAAHYTGTMMATNASATQPTCQNCATSTTPLWRRDEFGSVLCNACGLFLKLHGRSRPISLKTDVIKSRNRVKTMRPDLAAKKKVSSYLGRTPPPVSTSSYRKLTQLARDATTAAAAAAATTTTATTLWPNRREW